MPTSTNSSIQPGDVLLGKYRVERVLGQGGMGIVVAVRHLHLGELFAIKMMLPDVVEHPDAIDRFLREARASARLRGEHVARVHDVGTLESGAPYMVLEYLEGTDLENVLGSRGALEVGEAAAYVYQACEALAEAHAQGIVHRDLKPPNLFLIRRPNGSPCIKVLDFGISKDLGGVDKVTPNLTKTGTIMGSPHYMSPEQMMDSKTVDTRGDIWALGIILYELVTGVMPFVADTITEIIAKVLSTQPLPPSHVRPGIPRAFDAVVARCLEKNREQRFQSVQEFMAALRPFVNDAVAAAGTKQVVLPGTAQGTSSIGQSAVGWGQATISAQSIGPANLTGRTSKRTWFVVAAVGVTAMVGIGGFVAIRQAVVIPDAVPTASVVPAATISVNSSVELLPLPSASAGVAEPTPLPVTTPPVATAAVRTPARATPTPSTTKTKKTVKGFND